MNHPEITVSELLKKQGQTLAVAESCTGGLLANLLTNIPGSSEYFLLGIVAYSNESKSVLLKIPNKIIKKHGAVSYPIARLMAKSVRRIACADFGIGITGIAGPSGGTLTKPVGTVFISVATKNKLFSRKLLFSGSRMEVKRKTVLRTLSMLKKLLS